MDFLINPNVSFVLLVTGFSIAVLALLAPGTGILEIAALFMIALAGYGISNLPVNLWALLIMLLGSIPLLLLFRRTPQRQNLIALSSLAFVTGAAFLYRGEGWLSSVNIFLIIFLVPTTVGFAWFISKKSLEAIQTRPTLNPDLLIGMTAQASSDIRGQGTIFANGEGWTAHSEQFIPAGTTVRITARTGLVLEVEPIDQG